MKRKRIVQETTVGRGFTRWIHPLMRGYVQVCCDCGLAHEMQFNAIEVLGKVGRDGRFRFRILDHRKFAVQYRARRSPKYTKLARQKR